MLLLLTTASSPAQPRLGAIRGRVDIRKVFQPPERRPSVSELGAPPPRDIQDLRRAVDSHRPGDRVELRVRRAKSQERVHNDMERDRFFTAEQAVEYGLIDRVLQQH